jgi:NAD(P)H-dependent flavin oxidoreductase YrpB (nitropropane dioxygenase family)
LDLVHKASESKLPPKAPAADEDEDDDFDEDTEPVAAAGVPISAAGGAGDESDKYRSLLKEFEAMKARAVKAESQFLRAKEALKKVQEKERSVRIKQSETLPIASGFSDRFFCPAA